MARLGISLPKHKDLLERVKNTIDEDGNIYTTGGLEVNGEAILNHNVNIDGSLYVRGLQVIPNSYAPKASPAFTGTPTSPTPSIGDNSTKIATTEFVNKEIMSRMETAEAMVLAGIIDASTGKLTEYNSLVLHSSDTKTLSSNTKFTDLDGDMGLRSGCMFKIAIAGTISGTKLEVGDSIVVTNVEEDQEEGWNISWYVLQSNIDKATASTLGLVKVPSANGLSVDANGSLSIATATQSAPGVMSAADKTKLDKAITSDNIGSQSVANATNATKATQDGDGNVISSTYATKNNTVFSGVHRDPYYASNVCRHFYGGTPTEFLIKTKIRYVSGTHMPLIRIYGYAYGQSSPIELRLGFYIYGGALGWCGASSTGAWKPEIFLFKYTEDNIDYVAVGFKGACYFCGFQVDAQVGALGSFGEWFSPYGWSTSHNGVDTSVKLIPDVGTDNCISVPYRTMKTDIDGNATNADTVDGKHASDFLQLSGGTMTGNLTLASTPAINNSSNLAATTRFVQNAKYKTTGSVGDKWQFDISFFDKYFIGNSSNNVMLRFYGTVWLNDVDGGTFGNGIRASEADEAEDVPDYYTALRDGYALVCSTYYEEDEPRWTLDKKLVTDIAENDIVIAVNDKGDLSYVHPSFLYAKNETMRFAFSDVRPNGTIKASNEWYAKAKYILDKGGSISARFTQNNGNVITEQCRLSFEANTGLIYCHFNNNQNYFIIAPDGYEGGDYGY